MIFCKPREDSKGLIINVAAITSFVRHLFSAILLTLLDSLTVSAIAGSTLIIVMKIYRALSVAQSVLRITRKCETH